MHVTNAVYVNKSFNTYSKVQSASKSFPTEKIISEALNKTINILQCFRTHCIDLNVQKRTHSFRFHLQEAEARH